MSQQKILLIRSQDILTDSRVIRYEKWFKKHDVAYRIIGWDRNRKNITRPHTIYYRGRAGFQQRSKAIINRLKWNTFLVEYLFLYRKTYDVVHACDFDTVLPALVTKLFGKKVIFDIFDWFSDECKTGKILIDKSINILEKWAVKMADLVIICEEERSEQIGVRPKKYIVISNIPNESFISSTTQYNNSSDDRISIAYVGGIVEDRGLEELVNVASSFPDIQLKIAGYGKTQLVKKMKEYSKKYDNIKFYGKVDYNKAINIMSKADMLYAMYYKTNPNHKWAAPNKFYEAIFLKKPIITTEGTLVGNKVKKCGNGFVLPEGKEALKRFFLDVSIKDIRQKQVIIDCLYEKYKDRFNTQMQGYQNEILYLRNK